MKPYLLTISSKNEKSVKFFLNYFFTHFRNTFQTIHKSSFKKNKKKVVTILKSPHVNKIAQEQFEYRFFSVQCLIFSSHSYKHVILLKNIITKLFHDIYININCDIHYILTKKIQLLIFNADNFKILKKKSIPINIKMKRKRKKTQFSFNISSFLKICSIFGELSIT